MPPTLPLLLTADSQGPSSVPSRELAQLLRGWLTEEAEMLLDLYPLQLLVRSDALLFVFSVRVYH